MNEYKQSIVSSGMLPKGRPHAYTFSINFANANPYIIDLTAAEAQRILANIQTIYVNNQNNTEAVNVTIGGTGQLIIVPPNFIIQCPIFVDSSSANITISSANSTSAIQVILLDIPTDAYQFDSLGSTTISVPLEVSPTSGTVNSSTNPFYVETTNPTSITTPLEVSPTSAANSSTNPFYVQTQNNILETSDNNFYEQIALMTPNIAYANLSATTPITLIAPSTSASYIITNIHMSLTQDATLATAGEETITFTDSFSGTVFTYEMYIPATASGTPYPAINIPMQYIPNANGGGNQGTSLSVALGIALVTGVLNLFVEYGYTTALYL